MRVTKAVGVSDMAQEHLTYFDKANLDEIREGLISAFKDVSEQFGIKLKLGNIRFDKNSFSSKIEASLHGFDQAAEDYKNHAETVHSLPTEWLGQSFNTGQKTFIVAGLKPRRKNNPVVLKDLNGKRYGGTVEFVMSHMGKETQ